MFDKHIEIFNHLMTSYPLIIQKNKVSLRHGKGCFSHLAHSLTVSFMVPCNMGFSNDKKKKKIKDILGFKIPQSLPEVWKTIKDSHFLQKSYLINVKLTFRSTESSFCTVGFSI